MLSKLKLSIRFLISLIFISSFLSSGISIQAQETAELTLDVHEYAPYAFYQTYNFHGEGNEFAGMEVKTNFGPDKNGRYQFTLDNGGVSVVFVYALTHQGVEELAFFPEASGNSDLRYHEDSNDNRTSLILPVDVSVGGQFNRGYRDQEPLIITEIIPRYNLQGVIYYNVLVMEAQQEDFNQQTRYYYAPAVGLIKEEFIPDPDENYKIIRELKEVAGPTKFLVDLVQER